MITDHGLLNYFYRNSIYNNSVQDAICRNLDSNKLPISSDDVIDVHTFLERFGSDSGLFLQELGKNVVSYERLRELDLRIKLDLIELSPQVRRCKELFCF